MPPAQTIASGQGGSFSISFASYPAPNMKLDQDYQIGVVSKPLDRDGRVIAGDTIHAVVSQKTLGARLPTGLNAAAALEVLRTPIHSGGGLSVLYGPIVNHDTTTWVLDGLSDRDFRPRKFSRGHIMGGPGRERSMPDRMSSTAYNMRTAPKIRPRCPHTILRFLQRWKPLYFAALQNIRMIVRSHALSYCSCSRMLSVATLLHRRCVLLGPLQCLNPRPPLPQQQPRPLQPLSRRCPNHHASRCQNRRGWPWAVLS